MKGGLAVMLTLAEAVAARPDAARFDATFVFYVGEEIAEEWNGLRDLFARAPELVAGDLAVMLEPTDGWVEAGCQGTLHVRATYRGARAHTARPWMGDERDPPRRRRARSDRRRRSRARSTSTGWSTGRRCRRCGSRAASPTTWSPTSAASS